MDTSITLKVEWGLENGLSPEVNPRLTGYFPPESRCQIVSMSPEGLVITCLLYLHNCYTKLINRTQAVQTFAKVTVTYLFFIPDRFAHVAVYV